MTWNVMGTHQCIVYRHCTLSDYNSFGLIQILIGIWCRGCVILSSLFTIQKWSAVICHNVTLISTPLLSSPLLRSHVWFSPNPKVGHRFFSVCAFQVTTLGSGKCFQMLCQLVWTDKCHMGVSHYKHGGGKTLHPCIWRITHRSLSLKKAFE